MLYVSTFKQMKRGQENKQKNHKKNAWIQLVQVI